MRTQLRLAVSGVIAALVLAMAPAAASAARYEVSTADELLTALDAAGTSPGPDTIRVAGEITLDEPAVFDGDGRVSLVGEPGALITGTDPDQDVLVFTSDQRVRITELTVEGGRRGIVVVVPEDATGTVRLDLDRVAVIGTGHHGVQFIDGVVDLGETGVGAGHAVPDASLPTEALIESEVVGGSEARLRLHASTVDVVTSGRAALDQDGLRIDERGEGDIWARIDDSVFALNGADGIEFDEAGEGSVRSRVDDTLIELNGDFDVDADPDDGFDIDEAGEGDLVTRLVNVTITDNLDEGLDLDEEDEGRVVLRMIDSHVSGQPDENVKVTELGEGDVIARIDRGSSDGSGDDAIQLEEFDEGIVRGRATGMTFADNDDEVLDLLSLDITEEAFEELDDADAPLPTDGDAGRFGVRDLTVGGEGITADHVDTFGVRVRGDLQIDAFPSPSEEPDPEDPDPEDPDPEDPDPEDPDPEDPDPAPEADYTLTVLHVNDGESDLLPDDDGAGSISRFGELLQDTRRANQRGRDAGAIAVTSGDNFLASPEFEASLAKGVPFYDTIALEYLDFDAYTIGNHEFDFGPDVLADVITGLGRCNDPFISANLGFDGEPALAALEDQGCIAPSTVTYRDGRAIGIIGLTTPDLREVTSPGEVEILTDLAAIANAEAQRLTDEGVDIVILASHLQDLDNEVALAAQLSNVDAVIGGGGGEELSEPLTAETVDGATIPVVTVPGDYFDLGQLTLGLSDDGELVDFSWQLLDVTGDLSQDHFLLEQVEEPVADFLSSLAETVVATSEVGLNGVRGDVRTRETNVGNLLADSFVRVSLARAEEFGLALDGPIVGLQNGGGVRNDSIIGPGEVTVLDTFDVAPFTNFVSVLEDVAPADLVTAVEHGLGALPDPAGSFAQWSGLVVEYDGSAAAGSRVVNLTVDGTPYVVDGVLQEGLAPVDIATIDFLAAGNDGYDVFEAYDLTRVGTSYQQALAGQVAIADLTSDSAEYAPRDDVARRTRIIPVG